MSVDYFVGDLVLTYVGSFLAILMIYLKFYTQRGIQLAQQEAELAQSRTAIMLSQIQPHFLYNALATIKHLCAKQDPRAEEVVAKFSKYLRGNMDSLTNTMPIPFKSELNHLENYLTIERLRFPDVHIAYDLKTTAFALPALTVQPLVENAIRYGVTRNEDGAGTVTISSYEDESAWYVRIKDDGVGFNPEQVQYDGRSHIGISNTRQRLATMCQGTLDIKSVRDVGTTITVTLPKDGEACMR
jgi:LytS/YehU family sensor histidine kinase